jgi:hypothetical protein
MKILVHKCPWTDKLFEKPKAYAKHLKALRAEQRFVREGKRIAASFNQFVAPLYQLKDTDDIADWLTKNYMQIAQHFGVKFSYRKLTVPTADDYVEFVIRPLRFEPNCSTTHAAPFGQRHTGWSKDSPHVPEAGWKGYIDIYPKGKARNWFNSDHLKKIGINTGSGGGSDDHLQYDLIIFTKDFPRLAARAAANQILREYGKPGIDSNGKVWEEPQRGYFRD